MFEQMEKLLEKVEELKGQQHTHCTICDVTFKKEDLKRAEPYLKPKEGGGNINVTRVVWSDGTDTILPVSIQQFNEQFYK